MLNPKFTTDACTTVERAAFQRRVKPPGNAGFSPVVAIDGLRAY
jgi:hypothetical protein